MQKRNHAGDESRPCALHRGAAPPVPAPRILGDQSGLSLEEVKQLKADRSA